MSAPIRIAVLVKQVPLHDDAELGAAGRLVRTGRPAEMNPHCRRAVAQAVTMAAESGGSVTVLTLGPPGAESVLVEALAHAADAGVPAEAVLLTDPAFAGSDTLATARALAAALHRTGPHDLVLCGRNSVDADTGQVAPQVAELAGMPYAGAARALHRDGDVLVLSCQRDDATVWVELTLPAVVACAERLCAPCKVAPDERWPSWPAGSGGSPRPTSGPGRGRHRQPDPRRAGRADRTPAPRTPAPRRCSTATSARRPGASPRSWPAPPRTPRRRSCRRMPTAAGARCSPCSWSPAAAPARELLGAPPRSPPRWAARSPRCSAPAGPARARPGRGARTRRCSSSAGTSRRTSPAPWPSGAPTASRSRCSPRRPAGAARWRPAARLVWAPGSSATPPTSRGGAPCPA
ncbi:hypothetical protein BJF78_30280 [Pseudonocardia sp. CNS-139]|nr:hypothetical protein BJF78_30280 [Pseudonocardia sp. CNS-139]